VWPVVALLDIVLLPLHILVRLATRRSERRRQYEVLPAEDGRYVEVRTPLRSARPVPEVADLMAEAPDNMAGFFRYCVDKHSHGRCLGYRRVLSEVEEFGVNGNLVKKKVLGEYTWRSYVEVDERSSWFGAGLAGLGLEQGENICIFAETRPEWMEAALACYKYRHPIVTLYPNLGDAAVVHAINETGVRTVITSTDILHRVTAVLDSTPTVKNIIFMEDGEETARQNVRLVSYTEVLDMGQKSKECSPKPPLSTDPAVIMYTSGSTGVPKGVVLHHSALVSTVISYPTAVGSLEPGDIYLGYLPLAHILEMLSEFCMMLMGTPIGYSSPTTLTDTSVKIPKGCKGDAPTLRPTIMFAVPAVLDKIKNGVVDKINSRGYLFKQIFDSCLDYKIFWMRRGFSCHLLDRLIFRKVQSLVGGRVRLMLCGGAPLSPDTHDFVRACLDVSLAQGYGLTESCAAVCLMDLSDLTTGHVGPPLPGVRLRLVDWQQGGYTVRDTPHPRGEVLVGGDTLAAGYYSTDNNTDFFTEDGARWLRTGDVGQLEEGGRVRIIDRKKDIVKLQHGEYVSLGRVETVLRCSGLVENVCVYGEPRERSLVGLVVPDNNKMKQLAAGMDLDPSENLYENLRLKEEFLRLLTDHSRESGLMKYELVSNILLLPDTWSPETGMVTATFKLRRKIIEDRYRHQLRQLYHRQ